MTKTVPQFLLNSEDIGEKNKVIEMYIILLI